MATPDPSEIDLELALHEHFGFSSFNSGQREVIEHLMAGRSAAAVFATGAGKSLCYQLPGILLPGLTLVVSPLIALMQDQILALRARGISAHKLDSTLDFETYRSIMDELRSGATRLLYVAPERFNNERFREQLMGLDISLFAVDEAHCISEWGHNFRPDYLKLARFAGEFGASRILALTATATPRVLEDICKGLGIERSCAVRTPSYRPNLELLATPMTSNARTPELLERLRTRPPGAAIVYVTLQRSAERIAEQLCAGGLDARAYHAGMDPQLRAQTQAWFTGSSRAIVVATIAFGMGIDKSDIRYVYHYNLPKSLENYAQEIGRAGRDGAPSICEVLACSDDLIALENFVYGDTPTPAAVTGLVEFVFGHSVGETMDLDLGATSRRLDLRPLVLRTLLTYLELRGLIVGGTPFYSLYEFKPLMSSGEMLSRTDESQRPFVRAVLTHSKKARLWFKLDAATAAAALGVPRGKVVGVLDMLAERNMLELRAKQVRHRYALRECPAQPAELAAELHAQMQTRETSEVERLRAVLAWVGHDGCQVESLCAHFGETLERDCGHCSWCATRRAAPLPEGYGAAIDEAAWAAAEVLRAQHPELLSEARSFARLLCGIRSPSLSRAKLVKHEVFGSQAEVPFAEVLRRAQQHA